MTWLEWKSIEDGEREQLCQQLNPYEDWALFKEVEGAFRSEFGAKGEIADVFCGIGGGMGGLNSLTVTIACGDNRRVDLPKNFLGFPVLQKRETK